MPQFDWTPTTTWQTLTARARMVNDIRAFFSSRGFLEVETPLLSAETVVDRHIDPVRLAAADLQIPSGTVGCDSFYLQTSPEFAMKRLLAAGSGPIFQICKAFRGGEAGPHHNPEFTMLEWYDTRLDYAGIRLQLGELANSVLGTEGIDQASYREVFQQHAGVDPFDTSLEALQRLLRDHTDVHSNGSSESLDDLLDIVMATLIQPVLGMEQPVIVFDWPKTQAALAKTRVTEYGTVAERFELYVRGVELANGYSELLDADQLIARARENNDARTALGKPALPGSGRLADAMRSGLPECQGVALGVDRLLMVLLRMESIRDVIPFPFDRA